jgi:hypothetical protein
MDKKKEQEGKSQDTDAGSNKNSKGVDKAPGEELGKGEQVTMNDLKNKTVDRDPEEDDKKTGE